MMGFITDEFFAANRANHHQRTDDAFSFCFNCVTVISAAEDVTAPVPVRTTLGGGCEAVLLPAEQKPGESYRIVC